MMTLEQEKFAAMITGVLAEYVKTPTKNEIEAWWGSCRHFAMADVERVLKSHQDDPEDGKRAPRPVDVKRRMRAGSSGGESCAARGAAGQCQYVGIFSEGTSGGGQFYCPWHRLDRSGPEAERWIQVSHDVPAEVAFAKRLERMREDGARSQSVRKTAQTIALRHQDRPWQGTRFALPANLDAEAV